MFPRAGPRAWTLFRPCGWIRLPIAQALAQSFRRLLRALCRGSREMGARARRLDIELTEQQAETGVEAGFAGFDGAASEDLGEAGEVAGRELGGGEFHVHRGLTGRGAQRVTKDK